MSAKTKLNIYDEFWFPKIYFKINALFKPGVVSANSYVGFICVDTRDATVPDDNITLIVDLYNKGFSVVVRFTANGTAELVDTKTTQMVSDMSFSSVNIENGWSFDYTKVSYTPNVAGDNLIIDLRSTNAYDNTGF